MGHIFLTSYYKSLGSHSNSSAFFVVIFLCKPFFHIGRRRANFYWHLSMGSSHVKNPGLILRACYLAMHYLEEPSWFGALNYDTPGRFVVVRVPLPSSPLRRLAFRQSLFPKWWNLLPFKINIPLEMYIFIFSPHIEADFPLNLLFGESTWGTPL